MLSSTRLIGAAAVGALIASSAGCSSHASGNPEAGVGKNTVFSTPAPITATPQLPDTRSVVLPVEAYLFNAAQDAQVNHAKGILIARCMRRLKFDYPIPSVPRAGTEEYSYRRYGVTDAGVAAAYGYHAPPRRSSAGRLPVPKDEAERLALSGGWDSAPRQFGAPQPTQIRPTAQVNGQPVPVGGCAGEAERLVTGGRNDVGSSLIAQQIDQSYDSSLADARLQAVFAKWSACMKAKGFAYKTVVDVDNDPRWAGGAPASPREIATATADVQCKAKNNVVGVWSAVEAAYQRAAIEKYHEQLKQEKDRMDAALRKAAEVIAQGV